MEATDRAPVRAFRGRDLAVGESAWTLCGIDEDELEMMGMALTTHPRVLLFGKRGPCLLFADACMTARRMLLVCLPPAWTDAAGAMTLLGRRDVYVSERFGGVCSACAPSEETCRALSALFYDLDRIFNNRSVRSFGDYCRLIFEVAGCAPERRPTVPPMPNTPTAMDVAAFDYLEACLHNR